MAENKNIFPSAEAPILAVAREDVASLDAVLRGYYRSQIRNLKSRKDRKLARRLLQDHLVLPKSRQRTSKDLAYIKEMLGIEPPLLDQLEDSRLIRRIQKDGANPIYEVSHDTLIEPILAERSNRLAIKGFLKRAWKYLALILLLWFLFGMLFENTFELLPEPPRNPKRVEMEMDKQVIGLNPGTFLLPLPPLVPGQEIGPKDSILIRLPLEAIDVPRLRRMQGRNTSDTLSIFLASPIDVALPQDDSEVSYQTFSDVLVPLASGDNAEPIYATVSGSLRLSRDVEAPGSDPITEYNDIPRRAIELELGDTLIRPGNSSRLVPVNFTLQLSELFENEIDKDNIRKVVGDRPVRLNYTVRVGPAPAAPPPPKVEPPAVQGIEVQYSDGSKRFIPNTSSSTSETIHVVAAGETLFSIAKKYDVRDASGSISTRVLMELNGLQNTAISVGQRLRIPKQ